MQIEIFKVFCDLVETASFSRAASLNSITQSAVSQQIRALEQRYHVSLIERGKKNFSVTQEGRAFLEASREILHTFEHLGDRIKELQSTVAGQLRVATVYSIGLHELPPLLKKFQTLFPEVEVLVDYRRSAQVYTDVLEGDIDLGLVAYPAKRTGLVVEDFSRDKLVLICPPRHPLAGRSPLSLADLRGEKLISFAPDDATRKLLDRLALEQNVRLDFRMESDNIDTVKRAVTADNGLSIVPRSSVEADVCRGDLVTVEVDGLDVCRSLGIVYRRHRPISPAQREFVALLRKSSVSGVEPVLDDPISSLL